MRKQANRKVPQKRMCLRSLRKKAEYGRDIFGSACVRAALVLSLAAGALTLPSAAFPVMAETAVSRYGSNQFLVLLASTGQQGGEEARERILECYRAISRNPQITLRCELRDICSDEP